MQRIKESGSNKIKIKGNKNSTVAKFVTYMRKLSVWSDGSGVKATYKITSMKGAVKKVAISGKKSVKAGKTLKLKAEVTAAKNANKKLKWTNSIKKYASVTLKIN